MKKVLAISSVLLGVVFLAGCGQQPVSKTQPTTPAPVAQTPVVNQPVPANQQQIDTKAAFNKDELEKTVIGAVGWKPTDGVNNPKPTIEAIDGSLKAAKGKYFIKDAWPWISWQNNDGTWTVLLSGDGFKCNELSSVPSQYNNFFHDVMYFVDSKGVEHKNACIK